MQEDPVGFLKTNTNGMDNHEIKRNVERALRQEFRPEFLNRIDEIVIFKSLGREEIVQIVDLLVEEVQERLSDRGISIELTVRAKEWIAEKGFDPAFGARPLRRTVQRYVETPLGPQGAGRRDRRWRTTHRRCSRRRTRIRHCLRTGGDAGLKPQFQEERKGPPGNSTAGLFICL